MIRSYQRGLMKCMRPAKTKNGPNSLLMHGNLFESRLSLGDVEAALVQRAADDHAGEVFEAETGHGPQVVQRSDTTRVDELAVRRGCHPTQGVEIRTLHEPVDLDRRIDEAADPTLGQC